MALPLIPSFLSIQQNNFKLGLIARDGRCVISGCWFDGCVGAHILPVTRPEYYGEVLGHGDDPHYIFETEYGLLLSDTLHHAWDRGELALYPQVSSLKVIIALVDQETLLTWFRAFPHTRKRTSSSTSSTARSRTGSNTMARFLRPPTSDPLLTITRTGGFSLSITSSAR